MSLRRPAKVGPANCGWMPPQCVLTSVTLARNIDQPCSNFDRTRLDFGQRCSSKSKNLLRLRPHFGHIGSNSPQIWPSTSKSGRARGNVGGELTNFGRCRAKVGRIRAKFGQSRARLVDSEPTWPNSGGNKCRHLANSGRDWVQLRSTPLLDLDDSELQLAGRHVDLAQVLPAATWPHWLTTPLGGIPLP